MNEKERIREVLTVPLTEQRIRERSAEGWRLTAVEWEREADGSTRPGRLGGEIPYGLQIAADCHRLEDQPDEIRAMEVALELIVSDHSLSEIAASLNEQGSRTRSGKMWTQTMVFHMLPRLIEVAPSLRVHLPETMAAV